MIKFEDLKPNESLELLSEEQFREIRGGYGDTLPVDLNYGDDPGPFWGSNPLDGGAVQVHSGEVIPLKTQVIQAHSGVNLGGTTNKFASWPSNTTVVDLLT